jgi:hypothetical protein
MNISDGDPSNLGRNEPKKKSARRQISRENWWETYRHAVAVGDAAELKGLLAVAYATIISSPLDIEARILIGRIKHDLGLSWRWTP